MRSVRNFLHQEAGTTAVEYGLIAALISIAAIVAMGAVGNEVDSMFNTVADNMESAT